MDTSISTVYSILPTAILILSVIIKAALVCITIATFVLVLKIYKNTKRKENDDDKHSNDSGDSESL